MKTVNIAVYIDAQYVRHMGVMLRSAAKQLAAGWCLRVYVMHDEAEPLDDALLVREIGHLPNVSAVRVPFDARPHAQHFISRQNIPPATYIRLFAGELLPPEVNRVLLLDCDVVVAGDLSHLWQRDLDGNIALAVPDANLTVVGLADCGMFRTLGVGPQRPYFNAGVLLVDLDLWRAEAVGSRAFDLCRRHQGAFGWADQCLLNAALAGRWQVIGPEWNLQTGHFTASFRKAFLFDRQQLAKAKALPMIVHFTEPLKPWHAGCPHPLGHLYFEHTTELPPKDAGRPAGVLASAAATNFKAKHLFRRIKALRRLALPTGGEILDLGLYLLSESLRRPWYPLLGALSATRNLPALAKSWRETLPATKTS